MQSRLADGLHIIYDLGRTWTRVASEKGYVCPKLLDQDTLVIGNGKDWGSFILWRRIAAGKK